MKGIWVAMMVFYTASGISAPPAGGKPGSKGGQTVIDLEGDDITGKRRDPLGSIGNRTQLENKTELIQIRVNWNEEIEDSWEKIDSSAPFPVP